MTASRPLYKRVGYHVTQWFSRWAAMLLFRIRVSGREHVPSDGGVLVCSNHQSYLDPVLAGLAVDRRMNYLARKSLFRAPAFRWLIGFFDAIPIDRDGFSLQGIKETLRRLKQGELVLIFPEGTRTETGELSPLKPGICAVARRGRAALLPMAIAGAYEAWPRGQWAPGTATIHMVIGEPLTAEAIANWTDEQLIAELQARMQTCFERAQAGRER